MSIIEKLKQVKRDFNEGLIPFEELLLYVEPLLMQAIDEPMEEEKVKKIVNGIEKIIYTQIEPQKTAMILDLIEEGILFISSK